MGWIPVSWCSQVLPVPSHTHLPGWKCSHPQAWCLAGCPRWQMVVGPWWFTVPCAYDLITLRKAVCWVLQPGRLPQRLGGKVTSSRLACATQSTSYTKASSPCFLYVPRQNPAVSFDVSTGDNSGGGHRSGLPRNTHIGGAELRSETVTNRTQSS